MKRPPPDPDEEKEPSTPPCADPPTWPPAENAEVALFIIPGKPMPWASVIDVRSASRLQIAGFDPPLFEPRKPATAVASLAPEAAPAADGTPLLPIDEPVSELILNGEASGVEAPTDFDLELSAGEDGDAFDEPTPDESALDTLPPVWPQEKDEAPRWWAAASATAAVWASRLWSTARRGVALSQAAWQQLVASTARGRAWIAARPRHAARQFVAASIAASRATAARTRSQASRHAAVWARAMHSGQRAMRSAERAMLSGQRAMTSWTRGMMSWTRAMLVRQRATMAAVSRGVTAVRSRVVAGWPRVVAGRERVIAQWARSVAMWPRLVALIAAWRRTAIRAWANTRTHLAILPSAVVVAPVDLRRQLRLAADATAVVLLVVAVARLAETVDPLSEWTLSRRVDPALSARPLTMVAALAPAVEQRVTLAAPAIDRRAPAVVPAQATRLPRPRVESARPPAALTPRRIDTTEPTIAFSAPVARDAARADLRAPADRSRDIPVPAPFPMPREDSGPPRPDAARADLRPAPPDRSSDIPVPAPFPTPRADPPRGDRGAAGGELAANDGIAAALRHLQMAYERRDATLAKAVWPTVNERALARAFDGLRSQSVTFDRCRLNVTGADGEVECRGVTTYVTRVGSQDRRTESRQWKFRVQKGAESWLIVSANAR